MPAFFVETAMLHSWCYLFIKNYGNVLLVDLEHLNLLKTDIFKFWIFSSTGALTMIILHST